MRRWEARGRIIVAEDDPVPKVMGIVNVTPDSFSDRGRENWAEAAVHLGRALASQGADLLDIGGESTRPGAEVVDLVEELRRIVPVVKQLALELSIPLSIDTSKAEVAREALENGALIVNDITALEGDPQMADVVAEAGAGVVLMHMQGNPRTMQLNPQYNDVTAEVRDYLSSRVEFCLSRGIPRERIAVDPGIGFGKTNTHNLQLLRDLNQFANLGCVVLVGISRKGLLGKLTGRDTSQRMVGSAVSSLWACTRGVAVVRVHDVAAMVDAMKIWTALQGWDENS
jgi:dihydropteroate synthase